ncbi:hypothetical protein D3C87_1762770 [compost metagenome]
MWARVPHLGAGLHRHAVLQRGVPLEMRIVVEAFRVDVADGSSVPALDSLRRVAFQFVSMRIGRHVAGLGGRPERGGMDESLARAENRDLDRLAVGVGGQGARVV